MFWLSYECFSILRNAFLLKSAISSHNSCEQTELFHAWTSLMNNQVFKVKISSLVGNQSLKASTNSEQIIKNTMK